jgi:transposase
MGQLCQANELSKRLTKVPGVGPVTATIVAADLGEGQHYAIMTSVFLCTVRCRERDAAWVRSIYFARELCIITALSRTGA